MRKILMQPLLNLYECDEAGLYVDFLFPGIFVQILEKNVVISYKMTDHMYGKMLVRLICLQDDF